MPTPDAQLVQGLRAGEEAAFAELLDRYDAQLRRLARTFVRTDAQAADVVGETWLAVIDGIGGFENARPSRPGSFASSSTAPAPGRSRRRAQVPFATLGTDDGPAVDPATFDAAGNG